MTMTQSSKYANQDIDHLFKIALSLDSNMNLYSLVMQRSLLVHLHQTTHAFVVEKLDIISETAQQMG